MFSLIAFPRLAARSAARECPNSKYGRWSLAETAMGCYAALIGPRLRARGLAHQHGEIALGVEVLNRVIRVAKPVSVRIAAC